jgi:hypothetical protein
LFLLEDSQASGCSSISLGCGFPERTTNLEQFQEVIVVWYDIIGAYSLADIEPEFSSKLALEVARGQWFPGMIAVRRECSCQDDRVSSVVSYMCVFTVFLVPDKIASYMFSQSKTK